MNESLNNCIFVNVTSIMNTVQFSIYIPTTIIGFILNIFALWIFCFTMKKHTEASIYLLNLALLDFCLVVSLPIRLHFSQFNVIVSGRMCSFLESLYFTNMYGSIYTIMFISVDRYIAIKFPFLSKMLRSPKKTLCICIFIWVFVWTVALCTFNFQDDLRHGSCFHNMSDSIWSTHIIVPLEIFGFLIPMTVMLYCSIQIIRTLLVPVSSSSVQCEGSKANVIRIIISNLIVFLFSFLLSHIGIFLQFLVRKHVISNCLIKKHISLFVQVALCISNINCCLDAITYYYVGKEFRRKLVKSHSSVTQVDNTII
ncbi:G-protein coupled receptor 55 [Bufo gargarizans]|uniref:G-protein coupled receptor 55 n=1 Tax=Bufo gargarizans TaxID=30331 RepID=UPI001CF4E835|nr:G-protein coupled receptor 55 [Bufo gargarizans]XP_044147291.1 G-protein coupled receptor 55 [Bufo gargarizans]